jgi:hypothetical protein
MPDHTTSWLLDSGSSLITDLLITFAATPHSLFLPQNFQLRVRGKPSAQGVFCHDPWEGEIEQVIAATGFGASALHMKTTERMTANDGASNGSIDVQVAHLETAPDFGDVVRATRIESAG